MQMKDNYMLEYVLINIEISISDHSNYNKQKKHMPGSWFCIDILSCFDIKILCNRSQISNAIMNKFQMQRRGRVWIVQRSSKN
jgi:hypothetical protein